MRCTSVYCVTRGALTLTLFQVNDSSMALFGGAQGDDYRHIVELVVNKMEVYCRKASLSTTIRFLSSTPVTLLLLSACGEANRSRKTCRCCHCSYFAPAGERSIAISLSVCLSVCPRAYLWNRWIDLHEILYADPLRPWLGPPMAALRNVIYFRFYG